MFSSIRSLVPRDDREKKGMTKKEGDRKKQGEG
jgi:hypothetical protein